MEKFTLYYFSGTGNSLVVARLLKKQLSQCDVVSVNRFQRDKQISCHSARIGFIFPVFSLGVPLIVTDFIRRLVLDQSQYLFAIVTMGYQVGNAFWQVDKILKEKSKTLHAGYALKMGSNNNFVVVNHANRSKPKSILNQEEQTRVFLSAERKIKLIANEVKQEKKIKIKFTFKNILNQFTYNNFIHCVHRFDSGFYIANNCERCHSCLKICPVNNILLLEKRLVWQHQCQACLACYNFCPQKAIYHKAAPTAELNQHYHHPAIKKEDMSAS